MNPAKCRGPCSHTLAIALASCGVLAGACTKREPASGNPPAQPASPVAAAAHTPQQATSLATRPSRVAADAWNALLAAPPDFPAAAAILGRDDAELLREVRYTVPDSTQAWVEVEGVLVKLEMRDAFRAALEGYLAYVKEDVAVRAKALVGLDHLLAGIMKSTPTARMGIADLALNRTDTGSANLVAGLLRGWALNELGKLGEPAAYHDPIRKRDIINRINRNAASNTPDPGIAVP